MFIWNQVDALHKHLKKDHVQNDVPLDRAIWYVWHDGMLAAFIYLFIPGRNSTHNKLLNNNVVIIDTNLSIGFELGISVIVKNKEIDLLSWW